MEIYSPLEDSFMFSNFLNEYLSRTKEARNIRYLDMGCGSVILSEVVSEFISKENILCVDINKDAVKLAKSKKFHAIRSNLFSKVPRKKFDLITFNAPYLPEDKEKEPLESKLITTGGKRGDEISIEFLKQAKNYLKKDGKIFLLISSLTPLDKINKFKPRMVAEKNLFFEKLLILEFSF
jgi:release factor glutamine methyltransferase